LLVAALRVATVIVDRQRWPRPLRELQVAIKVTVDDEHAVIVVAGTAPLRELARFQTGPDERIAVAL